MHLGHAHQLRAVLAQALLHEGQAGPIAEHVAGGPQQGQQAAATSGVAVINSNSLPRIECRITSAARRMPGLMLTRPTQLPGRSSLSMASSWRKSLRSTATARNTVLLGQLLHRLEEIAAGDHRSVAGVLQNAFQLLHRHHFHRHIQAGFQFLGDQHGGADVLPRRADQHAGATAQPPVDLPGQQFPGLLQGAPCIQQAIHAFAHLAIEVGDAPIADVRRRLDFPWFLLVAHVDAGAGHRFHHAIGFQLAVHLADRVAVQSRLHRQLTGAGEAMPRRVMPSCDGEADLVVKLRRGRNVAFLLDMESHAGGTGRNAATIRSELPGDNWGVSCGPVTIPNSPSSGWVDLANGAVPLRCWWASQKAANDIDSKSLINRVYIVLPEVFGVNAWVRSVADRLAAQGHPALALPLFSRTAPDLELAYDASDLAEGRRHKDAPPASRSLRMSPLQSAGSGLVTRRPPSRWWASASGGMPLFWRPRCPG